MEIALQIYAKVVAYLSSESFLQAFLNNRFFLILLVILGAISVLNQSPNIFASAVGFLAIVAAAINIFGGFSISQRMLQLFKPQKKDKNDK